MLFRDYISQRYPKRVQVAGRLEATLRPLEVTDQPKLLEFFRGVPEEDRLFLADDVTNPDLIAGWCSELDLDRVFPLLAVVNTEIVANATLHRAKGGWMSHVGRVRVVVHPGYRGKGIAAALIKELVDVGVDIGLRKLDAEFISGQEAPMAAFEKLGFVRVANLPEHVLDRRGEIHDLVVMTYDLQAEETSPVD